MIGSPPLVLGLLLLPALPNPAHFDGYHLLRIWNDLKLQAEMSLIKIPDKID